MAVNDRTTVVEMRAMVAPEHEQKLTPSKVDFYPFQDIDKLTAALSSSSSAAQAAHRLGCAESDVEQWAEIYGLDTDALLAEGM